MKNNIKISIILLVSLLYACSHRQPAPTDHASADTTSAAIVPREPEKVKARIAPLKYDWYSTRMSVSIYNIHPEKEIISLTAFIVNKKDSALFITLNKMGIEAARLLLTKDSVKYANHLSREYYWGNYTWLKNKSGLDADFFTMQAIITAQDLPGYEHCFIADTSNCNITYRAARRHNTSNNMILEESITTDTIGHMLNHHIKDIATCNNIHLQYSRYTPIDNHTCYQNLTIDLPDENIRIYGVLKNTKFEVPGPTTSRVPVKYKAINTTP